MTDSENGQVRSVTLRMAERFGMDPNAFRQTMLATVFPNGKATNEQFAAVMIVADQHGLNPLTKEIYAFPSRGGGVVPVVGVDGWARIVNNHPQFDGVDFEYHETQTEGQAPRLDAITCRIFRKDRSHPISVTEYMDECRRNTDPWKSHPRRMLRHKSWIQCSRMAFSFSGIYDEDEAERLVHAETVARVVANSAQDLKQLTERITDRPVEDIAYDPADDALAGSVEDPALFKTE
jgi:phage recombination protein Bet